MSNERDDRSRFGHRGRDLDERYRWRSRGSSDERAWDRERPPLERWEEPERGWDRGPGDARNHGDRPRYEPGAWEGGWSPGQEGSMEPRRRPTGVGGMRGRGPMNYQRPDQRIHEDICDLLTDDDDVDASAIEVKVEQCEVTLIGTVPSRDMKRRAEEIAERVLGIRDIHNQVRVKAAARSRDPGRDAARPR